MRIVYLQDLRRMLAEAPEELEELLCQGPEERAFTPMAARWFAERFVEGRDRLRRPVAGGAPPEPEAY